MGWKISARRLFPALLLAVAVAGCSGEEQGGGNARDAGNAAQAAAQEPAREPARTSETSASGIPADEPVARVAAEVGPSVAQINVSVSQQTPLGTQEGEGVGSGVVYRPDGYVVTNHHVVKGASEVNVAFADGTTEAAEVVGTDPSTEIAVLRVDRQDLPAAEFADSDALLPGQLAVALGSPSGFESTVTAGVISGLSREFPSELLAGDETAARSLADLIQTDAAISPGNSGGALADRNGRIIGINVAYLPPAQTGAVNIGFAIPADTTVSIADQLIETGRVSTAYLGVTTGELTPEQAERSGLAVGSGAIVTAVRPGSPAAEAGVREDDIITSLGDTPVESYGDLVGALRDYRPGDTAELMVFRDGGERTLNVTLDELPPEG